MRIDFPLIKGTLNEFDLTELACREFGESSEERATHGKSKR
jgi:hypothetical protein